MTDTSLTPLHWAHEHLSTPETVPPLIISGETCPLVAVYGGPYNTYPLYLDAERNHGEPLRQTAPAEHPYFQYFFEIPGKGDVAIEIAAPEHSTHNALNGHECWVSAWDAQREQGIGLGHITIDDAAHLTAQLQDYLCEQEAFKTMLDKPASTIDTPRSWLGRMMESVKRGLGLGSDEG